MLASHKLSQCRGQLIHLYGKNPVLLLQTLSMLLQTVSFLFLSVCMNLSCLWAFVFSLFVPSDATFFSFSLVVTGLDIYLRTAYQEHKLLTEEFQQQCMTPLSAPMTPISAPMTPISAPMTPISAPMTPNMTPRSGGLPAISSTLNNLDNWGQSANIICQYLGNTKLVPCSSFQVGIPGLKHDVLSPFFLQLC